jgi:WD40 repeat protein
MSIADKETTLPDLITKSIDDKAAEFYKINRRLGTLRRGRKASPSMATPAEIATISLKTESKALHTAKDPVILSIDTCQRLVNGETTQWILTGGKDGSTHLVDLDMKSISNAKAHKMAVNSAIFAGNVIVTASDDKTVKFIYF